MARIVLFQRGALSGALIAVLTLPAPARPARAAVSWDLTADWSDTANPNGPWSYRHGAELLPHVDRWEHAVSYFLGPQPAWAREEIGTSRIPSFFRSSAPVADAHDYEPGDVVCHTQDEANGIGSGPAGIVWRSPVDGTVDVSGAVWMGRDIGRSNHWSLWLNDVKLTEGDIASGDPYSRAAPFDFDAGTGGAAALSSLGVRFGDVLKLLLERTSLYGDFVGVRMHVSFTSALDAPAGAAAGEPWLAPPFPNPTAGRANVRFRLAKAGPVRLTVLDLAGRERARLEDRALPAGEHTSVWQVSVPDGVYFLRLRVGDRSVDRRVVVLRH
jgi:hypothetical protein